MYIVEAPVKMTSEETVPVATGWWCLNALGLLNVPSLRYTRGLGWHMHCGSEVTE
jgi:hypothetical protein